MKTPLEKWLIDYLPTISERLEESRDKCSEIADEVHRLENPTVKRQYYEQFERSAERRDTLQQVQNDISHAIRELI